TTEAAIYCLLIFIGIIGNSMVLNIVFKKRNTRKVLLLCIGALALVDVLMLTLGCWQIVVTLAFGTWQLGDFICQLEGFCVFGFCCLSILLLTITAINRSFQVVDTKFYGSIFTVKRTQLFILLAYVLGILNPIQYLAFGERYTFHPGKCFCFQENKVSPSAMFYLVGYIALPIPVITVCYFRIFRTIRRHKIRVTFLRQSNNSVAGPNVEDIKATRTLFLTLMGFLCCWTPVLIIDIIDLIRGFSLQHREIYVAYTFLGTLSSCINPFIYGVMNSMFRGEYKKILRMI
ncbi:predicted protein, partial [Nematostella vectensis]